VVKRINCRGHEGNLNKGHSGRRNMFCPYRFCGKKNSPLKNPRSGDASTTLFENNNER